jgi:hypothetical protein
MDVLKRLVRLPNPLIQDNRGYRDGRGDGHF